MADDGSPKTPTKVARIRDEESFKTCKAVMPTPGTRRQLRMTPVRTSLLAGGKPFREVNSSGRKFNSRTKKTPLKLSNHKEEKPDDKDTANESADSNETFIRLEQEPVFDRDSLEIGLKLQTERPRRSIPKRMSTRPALPIRPTPSYRAPTRLAGTASRYLSQLNFARPKPKFKSTAELEKDYFSSLRSF